MTPAALASTRVESSLCLAALMLQLKNQILYCSVPLSLNSRRWRLAATCSARRTPPLRFSFHHHLPVGIGRCGGNSHYTLLIEVVISVVQHEQTERTNGLKMWQDSAEIPGRSLWAGPAGPSSTHKDPLKALFSSGSPFIFVKQSTRYDGTFWMRNRKLLFLSQTLF